jgi:hypothetical protein
MKKRSSWLRLISFVIILMPQFDIFSFFSQIFWVFIGFTALYLTLSFYLLPALATTLKIRKRKLAQTNIGLDNNNAVIDSSDLTESVKAFILNLNNKISQIDLNQTKASSVKWQLNLFSLKTESFRKFNFNIISKSQLVALFF